METVTLPALSVKLNKEQLKGVLSSMCDKAFKQYRLDHVFDFTGESQPDVFRSGTHHEGERGIECYLEFKTLSDLEDAPQLSLWTSNAKMNIHFNQKEINKALIDFATTQKHVPQGANVNHNCEVQWIGNTKAIVEVIIDVTYDPPGDHQ